MTKSLCILLIVALVIALAFVANNVLSALLFALVVAGVVGLSFAYVVNDVLKNYKRREREKRSREHFKRN